LLDSFFRKTPDVIKIDVEGGELDVLRGMEEILKRGTKIICEVHSKFLLSRGQNPIEISKLLKKHNYKIYRIEGWRLLPTNDISSKGNRAHYFFTKDSGGSWGESNWFKKGR
jgi:hypothetical protein